jgi:hypothetical protein
MPWQDPASLWQAVWQLQERVANQDRRWVLLEREFARLKKLRTERLSLSGLTSALSTLKELLVAIKDFIVPIAILVTATRVTLNPAQAKELLLQLLGLGS